MNQGNKTAVFFAIFVLVVLSFFALKFRLSGDSWRYSIHSDGKGYYAFLPAVFIYQDADFSFVPEVESRYYDKGNYVYFTLDEEGKTLNKYWTGVSLMIAPFFLLADNLAGFLGYRQDGYSFPYQMGVSFAAICWVSFACYCLVQLLKNHFYFSGWIVYFSLVATLFGTNLLYYTIWEPSMSHAFSFAALSAFLWFFSCSIRQNNARDLYLTAVFAGLLVLIRPTNFLLLLSGLGLFDSAGSVFGFFKTRFLSLKRLLYAVSILISFPAIQILYFKFISGKFWVDTYPGEDFNFLKPEFFNFLLSYRKGLWIYAPISFFALAGLVWMYMKSAFKTIIFSAVILLYGYLLSSWWMWYYGGSYGMRPVIDSFPMLPILLAFLFSGPTSVAGRFFFFSLGVLLISYTGIQTYQYTHWIMPWDGIDAEKFWKIFLCFSQDCAS